MQLEQLQSLELVDQALQWLPPHSTSHSAVAQRQLLVHHMIDIQVADLLEEMNKRLPELEQMDSQQAQEQGVLLQFSEPMNDRRKAFSRFLFDNVYRHSQLIAVRRQASQRIIDLFECLVQSPDRLPKRFSQRADSVGLERATCEYIAGMTDRFCGQQYHRLIEQKKGAALDWE